MFLSNYSSGNYSIYLANSTSSESLSIPPPTPSQKSILITMGVMAAIICVMWNVKYLKSILYPFKLVTVAFHEFGHAIMVITKILKKYY